MMANTYNPHTMFRFRRKRLARLKKLLARRLWPFILRIDYLGIAIGIFANSRLVATLAIREHIRDYILEWSIFIRGTSNAPLKCTYIFDMLQDGLPDVDKCIDIIRTEICMTDHQCVTCPGSKRFSAKLLPCNKRMRSHVYISGNYVPRDPYFNTIKNKDDVILFLTKYGFSAEEAAAVCDDLAADIDCTIHFYQYTGPAEVWYQIRKIMRTHNNSHV